jgi:hypothetical protein
MGVRNPRRPTLAQKKLISKADLDPKKWLVTLEDQGYLHLVDKGIEQREIRIIDRRTGELIED